MVEYHTFLGQTLQMTPWFGEDVVVLTVADRVDMYDPAVMEEIVGGLDRGWQFYAETTGREPRPTGPYVIDGRATIASVPETCGAGCALIARDDFGATGIEILEEPFFNQFLYQAVADNGEFNDVPFVEMGRNYWYYQEQLGAVDPFVNGFAIVNRFLSMEAAGVQGGPFHGNVTLDFETFRASILEDVPSAYFADEDLDWTNTLLVEGFTLPVPDNPQGWGAADLAAAMFYRIREDFGVDAYQRFWQTMDVQPAAATPEEAMLNVTQTATQVTGVDYSFLTKEGDWQFTVGDRDDNKLDLEKPPAGIRAVGLGFDGDDVIRGSSAGEQVFGGGGDDRLLLGRGNDIGVGGVGADYVSAGFGEDRIYGGPGPDRVFGGPGADWLDGGPDLDLFDESSNRGDILFGGGGGDTFFYDADRNGRDSIRDFSLGGSVERILVSGAQAADVDTDTNGIVDSLDLPVSSARGALTIDFGDDNILAVSRVDQLVVGDDIFFV